ncbi:phosphopantetheine-binding protein [Streptomyces sp. LaBMicrA B280]|uniref:phosphopantetheine-binding protein n=1 Tax=Streptomyces sp. LaBMicrA B280 TaxID=3391001 RepID=UPI003BA75C68
MTDLDRSTTTLADNGVDGGTGVVDPTGTLCALIADVLGLAAVDPGQSFTGLGGDSIQAIQVVSRARPAGLLVTTREVLRSETVAALAAGARAVGRPGAGAGPARTARRLGPFAPTPIMAWLGELGGPVDTYNQSLVLRTPAGFGAEDAVRVVQALLDTHDILRLRVPGGAATIDAGAAPGSTAGAEPTGAGPSVPPPGSVDARALIEHIEADTATDEELPGLVTERVRAARRLLDRKSVV